MKNLQKYTKAELISKLKTNQNNNQKSFLEGIKLYFYQIIELMLTFKNLLLKLTLISLIIGTFKKYRFFRKIWLLINTIVMGIFGLSLFDNSLITFFSNFISEIKFISYNIADYLSNTNFYSYLSKLFKTSEVLETKEIIREVKSKEVIKEIVKPRNEERAMPHYYHNWEKDHKLSDWLKPKTEQVIDNTPETNYKYILITTAVIITASLSWYYSDEIKTNAVSLIEWLMSFRSGPDGSTGNDSNSSATPTGPNLPTIKPAEIELVDKIDKGKAKEILTSPSLENLSSQAETAFRVGSPEGSASSSSSTETLKPVFTSGFLKGKDLSPINIETNIEPSSSSNTPIGVDSNSMFNIIRKTWKDRIPTAVKERINFIETTIKSEMTRNDELQIVDKYAEMIINYNKAVAIYENSKLDPEHAANADSMKLSMFYFRKWIEEYQNTIMGAAYDQIEEGKIYESPKIIALKNLED